MRDLLPVFEAACKGVAFVAGYVADAVGERLKAFSEYERGDFVDFPEGIKDFTWPNLKASLEHASAAPPVMAAEPVGHSPDAATSVSDEGPSVPDSGIPQPPPEGQLLQEMQALFDAALGLYLGIANFKGVAASFRELADFIDPPK